MEENSCLDFQNSNSCAIIVEGGKWKNSVLNQTILYFLQYVDQLSINSQPPIVRQKKCYFIARCCLVSFHLMKNRWDSNPWDTSALSLGPEKLCPHLPKKPSNNKLCTDISVGIAFGLVTPLVPKSVLKKKCACINKLKNTFLNFFAKFFWCFQS